MTNERLCWRSVLVISLLLSVSGVLAGQGGSGSDEKKPETYEMTTFQLALFVTGPNWPTKRTPEQEAVFAEHVSRTLALIGAGTYAAAGPFGDEGRVRGIAIVNAKSAADAEAILREDPAVKAGFMAVEIHPWYAAKNVMKPATDVSRMDTYYFGFLRRGPTWSPTPVPGLQEKHMEHIRAMAATGKLVIAGPFAEDGELRGVFVFKVGTREEAQTMADADPAVRAGRLAVDLHPWHVPHGALP